MSMYSAYLSLLVTSSPSPIDAVHQSLIARSDRWFFWLVVSSIVVVIGVCLEGPEASIALKRWYCHWRKREVPPENGRSLAIPASYLGLLLVIVGVAGEGVFESLSSKAETALRGHDERVLVDTISEAGTAKDSANTAAEDAKTAGKQSSQASVSASNARTLAIGARQEANSFKQEINDAKEEAADAVSRLADAENKLADATRRELIAEMEVNRLKTPRSLSGTDNLIQLIKPFSGTEYTLNVFAGQESIQLTKEIGDALDTAGWIRKEPTLHYFGGVSYFDIFSEKSENLVPSCVEIGIHIHAKSKVPLQVLRMTPEQNLPQAVRAAGALRIGLASTISPFDEKNVFTAIELDKEPGEGPVSICVGRKP